jgi:hypothetical protein
MRGVVATAPQDYPLDYTMSMCQQVRRTKARTMRLGASTEASRGK